MPDMSMLTSAAIVFFFFFILGLLIEKASGRKTAQRQREMYARSGDAPAHYLIDDRPSIGALMQAILLWCIGGYVATALLFFQSNFLWALTLFH